MGFRRFKRGYKADRLAQIVRPDGNGPNRPSGMRDPTDPYFPYQWYLVSFLFHSNYENALKQ